MFECSESSHVTCHYSHVTCHMSNAYVDHWDMLNNFCFHLYAPNSLFIAENCNAFFLDIVLLITLSSDIRVHRAGSQLKTKKSNSANQIQTIMYVLLDLDGPNFDWNIKIKRKFVWMNTVLLWFISNIVHHRVKNNFIKGSI